MTTINNNIVLGPYVKENPLIPLIANKKEFTKEMINNVFNTYIKFIKKTEFEYELINHYNNLLKNINNYDYIHLINENSDIYWLHKALILILEDSEEWFINEYISSFNFNIEEINYKIIMLENAKISTENIINESQILPLRNINEEIKRTRNIIENLEVIKSVFHLLKLC